MPSEPLRVAVAVGVDLGFRVRAADERIVGGRRAVVAQAQHLADVAVEILREHAVARVVGDVAGIAVADGQIEHTVGPDLGAARGRARAPRVGDEDFRDVLERRAVEAAARERDRRVAAVALFHVREVEQAVTLEVRMQHDRVQAARAQRIRGPARDRCRVELAAAHDAQVSGKLRHEKVGAARQKRQVPRPHESVRDRDDVNPHEIARGAAAVRRAVR